MYFFAALAANSLIFVAKSAAWFVSGGSSLLAEAIHSLADIGNQAMLRVGITYAAQAPTAQYPFGHMRDKFIFRCGSFIAICMLRVPLLKPSSLGTRFLPCCLH